MSRASASLLPKAFRDWFKSRGWKPRTHQLDLLVSNPSFTYTTDQRSLIAFCQESVERLIRLVKDILDVSKIEAGVLSIQFTPTSLNELVEKCLFWVPQLPGGQGDKSITRAA